MTPVKIDLLAGTRPNVMKVAPVFNALSQLDWCAPRLVFIRQHEYKNMSSDLLKEFSIDEYHILEVNSTNFGDRMGSIIGNYTEFVTRSAPDAVLVPGDVDAAVGGAIAAKRANLPVIHLEAGLRSYDRRMPEEINRILIDSISDLLLTPSEAATQNLIFHEGHPSANVDFVGNVMIDSVVHVLSEATRTLVMDRYGQTMGGYAVATFHRPANVDEAANLRRVIDTVRALSRSRPVIFPVHPRTRRRLREAGLEDAFSGAAVTLTEPLGYGEFINLVSGAAVVVTDSGGIQEETSYLGVPCLTLRETTERPITQTLGTNQLLDFDTFGFLLARMDLDAPPRPCAIPLWDGRAAWRVAHSIKAWWRAREGQERDARRPEGSRA